MTVLPIAHADDLYDELGGFPVIQNVVSDMLHYALNDRRIKAVFQDADFEQLEERLAQQFCVLADGPCQYTGKDMKTSHEDLKITNAQFNALVEDLQKAMDNNTIAPRTQNRLLAKLAPMQREIVTK